MSRLLAPALVALALLAAAEARGAGFQIQEQSGRALGSAYVGEAAAAEDPSTIFFNPAGLTRLKGTQLAGAVHLILPNSRFENRGSIVNPAVGDGLLRGGEGGNAGEPAGVPVGYLAHQLTDRWRLGLGLTSPWGLVTDWERGWIGRYHARRSELKTIDIAPTVAVRVIDGLSLGAGLDVQYAYAKLSNELDLGTICALNAPTIGLPPAACGAIGLPPQSVDGFVTIRGESWAVGYNLGLLWEPTDDTRLGVAYRSRVDHTLEGDVEFRIPRQGQPLRQTGALVDTGGMADLDLPDVVRFDVFHRLNHRWAVQGGFSWTHWSRFEELVFEFDNPAQPTIVEPEDWDDSFRAGIAVLFRPLEPLGLRAGFAYDFTPVPNARRRTPRIPDSDRIWLAGGVGFAVTDWLVVDAGYAHLFGLDEDTRNPEPISGNVIRGTFSGSADIIGVQGTLYFH
jgi:long-chain fatty acid transport protein